MSVMYAPVAGATVFIGVAVALDISSMAAALTLSPMLVAVVGAGCGVLAMVVWLYSPLPDHNGGYGAPRDDGRYWGFSQHGSKGDQE